MKVSRLWWVALVCLVVAVPAAVAAAQTTTTAAGGTEVHVNPGSLDCTPGQFEDLNPGPGQEQFLFILTSPVGNPTLTVVTSAGTQTGITGTQQGNGSIHFVVTVAQGVTITDAFVSGQAENSNLTISHCELGPTPTTTTVAAATTTTVKPPAPAAVTVTPRLTG